MFMMLASLKVERKYSIDNFLVVCVFSEVSLKDINSLPPEYEVEFLIDLVCGTRPISMASCRISVCALSELKKQL